VNAGQLVDYIRTLTGQALQSIPTGHILNLINTAQEEVSRETKLPRRVVQYDNLTAANQLVLPLDARKESLIAVYQITKDDNQDVTDSRSMQIYDFIAASRMHPNWTTWDPSGNAMFIMYDPAYDPDCPRPAPGPSPAEPQSFRVIYVVKPDPVTSLDSLVLDGKFEGLTTVLAYRVAYLLTRDGVMLREYEKSMNALAGQSRPANVVAQNPMYRFNAPGGARG
jgi:hypothetical protein